jgi:ABC-type Fe3+ transport system substrate-binding protein
MTMAHAFSRHARRLARGCVALALAAVLLASCDSEDSARVPQALVLNIISPHGSDIRREFAEAFNRWHVAGYHRPVHIEWQDIGGGGTENITKFLSQIYQSGDTSGDDIVFGGGSEAFLQYASLGFLTRIPLAETQPDPLDQVKEIYGTPLRDPHDLWVAAAMSSFGIEINKQRIAELGLETPRTWEQIAGPRWIGRLSLADPSKSGSVKTSYEMILQQYGWERGWAIVTELFANTAVIRDSGAAPAEDVGSAEAIAGIVIDFYGRIHITRAGPSIVGFVIPEGGSTIDPDPIAMLKGAPHAELAARFIRFVVSPEGQRLWTYRPGIVTADGKRGPAKSALGRLSVLPSLYETESANMLEPSNPFTGGPPLKLDLQARASRARFIGDLIKSALIDNQEQLVRVRRAIRDAGDPADLLKELVELPPFQPTRVDGNGGLVLEAARPLAASDLRAVADEYRPSDPARARYAERIQAGLRELWRQDMAERLERLLRECHSRSR